MAPRTSWKGFLKLSLVSVPVKAFTAHDTKGEVRLNQLHADCHQRIRYQKLCPEHGPLENDDIVSGHEYAKGQYVVIDPKEVAALRRASDRAVRIEGFVAAEEIDPVHHAGRTYYLLPDGAPGGKPYALLHRGMTEAGVVAIARAVISGKDQLVMLRAVDDLLVLTVLFHAAQVKPAATFGEELEEQELEEDERALTHTLISASTLEDFDIARFEDEYTVELKKLIDKKVAGEEIVAAPDTEEPRILNLMDALKKSVAEAQHGSGDEGKAAAPGKKKKKAKKAARKVAPSAAARKKRKKSG